MLKIPSAKVVVTCPGRNYVTLIIETSDGVRGVGDATLNGRELAVASVLQSISSAPHRARPGPRRGHLAVSVPRRLLAGGPVPMSALAAVDMALWDIKGSAPVCRFTTCSAAPLATG